jgi:putative hydrolase of HD superfamily
MDARDAIVDFLFEVGILARTPRSGFAFLGSGEQSVAEHLSRVMFIGYALAHLRADVDAAKVLRMCLLHDLAETRTSDLNYVHQRYAEANEHDALRDIAASVPFGEDIRETVEEYEARASEEALLAKDADVLELILSLKEQADIGNARAHTWIPAARERLRTPQGRELAERIVQTDSDRWWFADKADPWWVTRGREEG